MSEVERLIRYCKVDTQSDPDNENVTPSSEKQFDLAKMLKQELEELGLEDVTLDEHCYVYAWLPSNELCDKFNRIPVIPASNIFFKIVGSQQVGPKVP